MEYSLEIILPESGGTYLGGFGCSLWSVVGSGFHRFVFVFRLRRCEVDTATELEVQGRAAQVRSVESWSSRETPKASISNKLKH